MEMLALNYKCWSTKRCDAWQSTMPIYLSRLLFAKFISELTYTILNLFCTDTLHCLYGTSKPGSAAIPNDNILYVLHRTWCMLISSCTYLWEPSMMPRKISCPSSNHFTPGNKIQCNQSFVSEIWHQITKYANKTNEVNSSSDFNVYLSVCANRFSLHGAWNWWAWALVLSPKRKW